MNGIVGLTLGAVILAALADGTSGELPLRRGLYVDVAAGCQGAASATQTWFGGGYVIQAPHAHCSVKSVAQEGGADYLVTAECRENAEPASTVERVDRIRIVSDTEYQLENAYGRFHARWCRG